jgi:tetratricopeptide (TPR) repeat protein
MYKYLFAILVSVLICSCSSTTQTIVTGKEIKQSEVSNPKEAALEHFINGATAEAKGDVAAAILEYQDALALDSSSGVYYALAKNYLALNKLSLALNNSKKAVALEPQSVEYLDLLAEIYSTAHQNDSSAAVLERIITLDSSRVTSYYQLAMIYESTRPAQAIEIYKKIVELIGPEWNVLIRMAEINEKLGNVDDAASNIKELLSLDPANSSLQKLLADFYIRTKMDDNALEILNDIIELTPDDLEAHEKKAKIFIGKSDWPKASEEYSFILGQHDVPLDIKVKIAGSFFSQSFQDSTLLPVAKSMFAKIDNDTTDWQVKMYLGAIAVNEKNDSLAIGYFKKVTELAGWNVDGWVRLAGMYFDNKKYDDAIIVLQKAVESFPENFPVNLLLGLSLSQNEKHSEAKIYLKKAVELNPSDVTALSAYGYTLNQLKESTEAINYLTKALALKPDDVNLMGTLGLIYDSMKMWAQCDSIYEHALSIDSLNALVNNNYAYSLSERGLQLERALNMVKISIKADPKNSSYLDTIGWIYFKLGSYKEARENIENAIKIDGETAVTLEHLGDVLYMMGRKDDAKIMWQKSFDMDSTNVKLKEKIEKGEI